MEATVTIPAPIAQYLLALAMDEKIRSEGMDALAKDALAPELYPGLAHYIFPYDAPNLAREALAATLWKAKQEEPA